jgi:hypothetical protein
VLCKHHDEATCSVRGRKDHVGRGRYSADDGGVLNPAKPLLSYEFPERGSGLVDVERVMSVKVVHEICMRDPSGSNSFAEGVGENVYGGKRKLLER